MSIIGSPASGPKEALRLLSDSAEVYTVLFIELDTDSVVAEFHNHARALEFAENAYDGGVSYGVAVFVRGEAGFPMSSGYREECRESRKFFEHFGHWFADFIYASDGKFVSAMCDEERCCPLMGKEY